MKFCNVTYFLFLTENQTHPMVRWNSLLYKTCRVLFSVGLHPRRNSNTTSVVFSYYVSNASRGAAIDYRRGCEPTEHRTRKHESTEHGTRNTNPRNTNLIVFFILIKNSVVYFTGIKNLRFTSPPILCHHFVVAFVIIVVASTR